VTGATVRPVLVTGATGRIGREVIVHLLGAGVPVRALTRRPATATLPATTAAPWGSLGNPHFTLAYSTGGTNTSRAAKSELLAVGLTRGRCACEQPLGGGAGLWLLDVVREPRREKDGRVGMSSSRVWPRRSERVRESTLRVEWPRGRRAATSGAHDQGRRGR
jgi:NmrA-like family